MTFYHIETECITTGKYYKEEFISNNFKELNKFRKLRSNNPSYNLNKVKEITEEEYNNLKEYTPNVKIFLRK